VIESVSTTKFLLFQEVTFMTNSFWFKEGKINFNYILYTDFHSLLLWAEIQSTNYHVIKLSLRVTMLSYPHFGPKNTRSISFTIFQNFQIHCIFYCASVAYITVSVFQVFCIKSYKRVFWSFPTKEPIFSPYNLSLSLFNWSA